MKFKVKKFLIPAIIIILLIVFGLIFRLGKVDAEAYKIKRENAVKGITATGTVRSNQDISLSSSVVAEIREIRFKEGDFVKKGQVLALLNNSQAEGNVTSAEGQLDTASAQLRNLETEPRVQNVEIARAQVREIRQNVEALSNQLEQNRIQLSDIQSEESRLRHLYEQGAVSFREYERTKNQRAQIQQTVSVSTNQIQLQQARLTQARQNLSLTLAGPKTEQIQAAQGQVITARGGTQSAEGLLDNYTLRAPISGYVTQKLLDKGEIASSTSSVLRMVAPDSIYLAAEIEETQLQDIKAGQTAFSIFDAYPAKAFKSSVYEVIKDVNPISGTFIAKVRIPYTGLPVMAGMTADITIVVREIKNIVIIPTEFIQIQNKKQYVYKKIGNKSKKTYINAIIFDNNRSQVLSGLNTNDVIVKGYNGKKLKDDKKIKIKEYYKE